MAVPFGAQDKLAFLLSLVPYLIDRGNVDVSEAAAHFGVPPEEMRSAVRLIAVSGVPGESASYGPDDLFDIDWDALEVDDRIELTHAVAIDDSPRFSAREAAALLAGLQYLSALPENHDRAAIASLSRKLASGASAAPSPVAVASRGVGGALAPVRRAVTEGLQIEFDYRDARGTVEHRIVDPLRIDSEDQSWYLRAWDHSREAVRTFRVDRMSGTAVTGRPVARASREVALPDRLFDGTPDDQTVRLSVSTSAIPLLGDFLPEGSRAARSGDGVARISVRVGHFHALKRLVAGLPGLATVETPAEAREAVAEWAEQGLAQYRSAPAATES
ncbi:MAG: WYL domain-containing protein [Naasia sp.]